MSLTLAYQNYAIFKLAELINNATQYCLALFNFHIPCHYINMAMKGLKYPLSTENYSEAMVSFHRPNLNKKWHSVMPSDANKHPNNATD